MTARIGRRLPKHAQPLRCARQRTYLKDLARAMLLVIAVMLISALTVALIPKGVRYDCATAAFHPDVPQAVNTECKKNRTTA